MIRAIFLAYDKREYLKENDARREMDKAMKTHKR